VKAVDHWQLLHIMQKIKIKFIKWLHRFFLASSYKNKKLKQINYSLENKKIKFYCLIIKNENYKMSYWGILVIYYL